MFSLQSILGCGLLLSSVTAQVAPGRTTGTVYYNAASGFSLKMGVLDPTGVSWGSYTDMNGTASAFGQLSITTTSASEAYNDTIQMFAAGYLEGALTMSRISSHLINVFQWLESQFKNGIPPAIDQFFITQDAYARANVASNTSSPIWQSTGLLLSQMDGLYAGYNAQAAVSGGRPLTMYDFQKINAIGDFLDLIPALSVEDSWDWTLMTDQELIDRVRKTTHCSAFVKVTGDLSEMYFSHAAWFIWQSTTRIFKHYNFDLKNPAITGQKMSFASYPAYLSSLDDFYSVWSSGINVLETTNSIFNMSLYKLVVPQSLFAWQRVRNANMLASTGPEWATVFTYQNSGTYNNQYDVVNVGMFTPGQALLPNTLTIVEQIPGLVVSGDATQDLERGYFPSYNVPYFEEIYVKSGYKSTIDSRRKAGEPLGELSGLDYQMAPRAQIFRRDNGLAKNFDAFLGVMRYNDYTEDPYSKGSPWNAICSRGDKAGSPDGCLDCKAGTAADWSAMRSFAINGPTTGSLPPGGNIPPFQWTQFPSVSHVGLPDTYDFAFEAMVPDTAVWGLSPSS